MTWVVAWQPGGSEPQRKAGMFESEAQAEAFAKVVRADLMSHGQMTPQIVAYRVDDELGVTG